MLPTSVRCVAKIAEATNADGMIIVSSFQRTLQDIPKLSFLHDDVSNYLRVHSGAKGSANLLLVDPEVVPHGRLILSGTGPITRDFDDVRRFQTAARNAMKLALSSGMKRPVMATVPCSRFCNSELVAALGLLGPMYVPLNVREETSENQNNHDLYILNVDDDAVAEKVAAIESAFTVCRDIGEQGPERMAPPRVADYVEENFKGSSIKVEVENDQEVILREYPLMHAVNRCANTVPEHRARLIRLEYVGEGDITDTYFLVGKGVTLDTGGCDLKTGGHMFGMCRDKYGSAVLAGFFEALDKFKPKNIKVVGYMCMVRNSIGARAYTCDEVITARSGKRIHIYNTDAEGRITMLDPLTRAKEEALSEVNPHLMTLATLTGHEILSYGYYATIMDNGPAKQSGWARKLQEVGDIIGQPIEISRLQPEDFAFHLSESPQADLRQGNTKPSVQTLRGHQTPGAFLIMASGIDKHGLDSEAPLKFSHIDMGGCQGDHPDTSFPNPLLTLVAGLILPHTRHL